LIKKLIVSHGQVAAHLVHAARRINAEPLGDIRVLCLEWDISLDKARRQVADVLRELGREEGVLILTDVFGATPSNACAPFLEHGVVEMVTGVNLPMVMRLGTHQSQPGTVTELADWIRGKAVKSIVHLGDPPGGCKPPAAAGDTGAGSGA
jgi:PTS system mannose-specific IIA component